MPTGQYNLPPDQRPREKLMRDPSGRSLSDAELLAILLNTGTVGCPVVELAQPQRRQVAVRVEGVEMGAQGRVHPEAALGDADAGIRGDQRDRDEVEGVHPRGEGLLAAEALHRGARVLIEDVHLRGGIALRHDDDVDAALAGAALQQVAVFGGLLAGGMDQDVGGIDAVGQGGHGLAAQVVELDGHVRRRAGHRQQEDVLEAPAHMLRLVGRLPFLEEGAEGGPVKDFPAARVLHADLAVALERDFVQARPGAGPAGDRAQLVQGDDGLRLRPAEDIIHAQRPLLERAQERFLRCEREPQQQKSEIKEFFHGGCLGKGNSFLTLFN